MLHIMDGNISPQYLNIYNDSFKVKDLEYVNLFFDVNFNGLRTSNYSEFGPPVQLMFLF